MNERRSPTAVGTLAIVFLIGTVVLVVVVFRIFYGVFPGMAPGAPR